MSFLERTSGIADFSKAVISLWFRVPAASLTAAANQFTTAVAADDGGYSENNLLGMIPLLSFGANPEASLDGSGSTRVGPCFIGVFCGDDPPRLAVRLQYTDLFDLYHSITGLVKGNMPDNFYLGFTDIGVTASVISEPQFITVTADTWHHVLVSFDMSGGCSSHSATGAIVVDSSCKLYVAFDDVNKSGEYLWPCAGKCYDVGAGVNDVISMQCLYFTTNPLIASRSFAAGDLPSSGQPLGFPTTSDNIALNYNVENAEAQIYTGVSINTSVEINRRAFVTAGGTPEPSATAQALLGQAPAILLHGSANWIAGHNTGSAGPFTPTGTITSYTPGPTL